MKSALCNSCGNQGSYQCYGCLDASSYKQSSMLKTKPNYQMYKPKEVKITNVIFNPPATIVFWSDGTKTVVKCNNSVFETFDPEKGLAMAIAKKVLGNKGNYYNEFKKWISPYSLKVLEDAINGMFTIPKCYICGETTGNNIKGWLFIPNYNRWYCPVCARDRDIKAKIREDARNDYPLPTSKEYE